MTVKIFIDAGHGGSDAGAQGNGLTEAALTLDMAKRVRHYLMDHYKGHTIKMTRMTDGFVSLDKRTDMANRWGADYFLSIHINAGGGTGFESYIFNGAVSAETTSAQKTIHTTIVNAIEVKDRGKKTDNLAVLRQTKMPAILTENLFIDTAADAKKLKSNAFLDKLAKAHAEGVAKVFELEKKKASKPKKEDKPVANKENPHKKAWEKAQKTKGKDGKPIFDGTRPGKPLTREQAATVLDRLGLLK